jgi:hypothetical protein
MGLKGQVVMSSKFVIAVPAMTLLLLSAGDSSAWDPQWQFRQEARSSQSRSSITFIEMHKKYDHDSMKRFKGTTDISSGHTVMRNLNGETMRGYIDKDGFGLLRDQDGNFQRVNTR